MFCDLYTHTHCELVWTAGWFLAPIAHAYGFLPQNGEPPFSTMENADDRTRISSGDYTLPPRSMRRLGCEATVEACDLWANFPPFSLQRKNPNSGILVEDCLPPSFWEHWVQFLSRRGGSDTAPAPLPSPPSMDGL